MSEPQSRRRPSRRPPDAESTGPEDVRVAEDEEALCQRVVEHLREQRPSRPPPRVQDDDALIDLRDQIATARLEDVPALVAQMEQISAVASRRGQAVAEAADPKSPYFGHLRLREGSRTSRDVLIGKTTYIEPREGIRIVDWRHAPVSQLYYRYDEGQQYEETFGEREVEGVVEIRRTVTIDNGELRRVSAPQGIFVRTPEGGWRSFPRQSVRLEGGEGSAVRAEHLRASLGARARGMLGGGVGGHGQREDRHLPEIAALLDPRQFELISRPDSGLVIIQGGAGSGKTTIGVHRMAYLAYQSPARFTADRMLVVVGTPALREYIGHLLSALDLEGVRVVTFQDWARKMRGRCFPWLDPPIEDNTPPDVQRLKTSPAVAKLLEARAHSAAREGKNSARDALWLWAEVLTNKDALARALATEGERAGFDRLTVAQLDRAWEYCSDRCPAVVDYNPEDADEAEEPETVEATDGVIEVGDERARLDPEDDALLLRAYQIVCGPLPSRAKKALRYEHLFVDEAQDLAAIDISVLAQVVTTQRSITLAGDTAQRLHVDTGFASWDEVLETLSPDKAVLAIEPLRIAYRSTREVLAVARAVLGPLADPEPPLAPRSGAPVEHHHFPNPGAAAAFLGDALRPLFTREPHATVAVLARYPEQADAYYDALGMAEVPNLRRVRSFDFAFRPGVEVTEIRQVKGLEFDYVVLVDVNTDTYPPTSDEARYQLHIGATRAAHQLWLLSTGAPSPLIPEAIRET